METIDVCSLCGGTLEYCVEASCVLCLNCNHSSDDCGDYDDDDYDW